MHACRAAACCPVCVRIPELFVWVPTAVLYATKCCVTSHGTSTGLLGTFQASNICEWYTKKLFRSSSIILATLNLRWEFPFNSIDGWIHKDDTTSQEKGKSNFAAREFIFKQQTGHGQCVPSRMCTSHRKWILWFTVKLRCLKCAVLLYSQVRTLQVNTEDKQNSNPNQYNIIANGRYVRFGTLCLSILVANNQEIIHVMTHYVSSALKRLTISNFTKILHLPQGHICKSHWKVAVAWKRNTHRSSVCSARQVLACVNSVLHLLLFGIFQMFLPRSLICFTGSLETVQWPKHTHTREESKLEIYRPFRFFVLQWHRNTRDILRFYWNTLMNSNISEGRLSMSEGIMALIQTSLVCHWAYWLK